MNQILRGHIKNPNLNSDDLGKYSSLNEDILATNSNIILKSHTLIMRTHPDLAYELLPM